MTLRGILIVLGIFALAFLLLFLGKCGYERIEVFQSIDNVVAHTRAEFPDAAPIDGDTLTLYRDQDPPPVLIDTRGEEPFAVSHLDGALRASTISEMIEHLRDVPPAVDTVVLYSSLGLEAAELAGYLSEDWQGKIFYLEGGIFRWANQGRPLVSGNDEPTRTVHPENTIWSGLLEEEVRHPLNPTP